MTSIFAVDPGGKGAGVDMFALREANVTSFFVRAVYPGKPLIHDAQMLENVTCDLYVIERQAIRMGRDSGAKVKGLSDLFRTIGRWDLISERPEFAAERMELAWGDIKTDVQKLLAVIRWPDTELAKRLREQPFAEKANAKASEMKLAGAEAVVKLLLEMQVRAHFLNRNGRLHDGSCDAFLLGVGAWLKYNNKPLDNRKRKP